MIARRTLWQFIIVPLVILSWGVGCHLWASTTETKTEQVHTPVRYQLPKSTLEKPLTFAGELIPLDRPDVRSRIVSQVNFLLLDAGSVLADWLTEKTRYSWLIEEVFRKEGVPLEFALLEPVLSGVQRNSSKSAGVGVWLLETTCTSSEGVEMSDDNWHDDRMDLELSTRCFASRIKAIRKDLVGGSWLLAAAAYVTSPKIIQDSQLKWNSNSFWDIPLPPVAEQLICRWIALSVISSNRSVYGLKFKPHSSVGFDQVTGIVLTRDLSVADIARMTGDPPRAILQINLKVKPSGPVFPAKVQGKAVTHTILAPKGKGQLLVDKLRNAGYVISESNN
ncbi:MAG: hypothetical protein WCG29_03130 [Desulfomonile sp.]|nr:hypothetical protein [Deltaproteobacteria bacterium]